MKLVDITSGDVPLIKALRMNLPVIAFRPDEIDLQKILSEKDKKKQNLSKGILINGNLVACALIWIGGSLFEYRAGKAPGLEEVLILSDVMILPEHRHRLYTLFRECRDEIDRRGLQDFAIEAMSTPDAYEMYSKHRRIFERLGYHLVYYREYKDPITGRDLFCVRFHRVQES